ncbi:NSFL1 cofactor p47 [Scaptodrosophila lebanonensis]|uniref:NSFL1 cofactor p47 n=1 Tax=Drosophila lebanonensis TaxID=7225 RepID=A0A6J2T8N6_DROLE|nr:NSFL1 cofactor p47 [Scaptodrosophila lebanonensis]
MKKIHKYIPFKKRGRRQELPVANLEGPTPVSEVSNDQMSHEQKVISFMRKHGVKEDVARYYLSSNGWLLDQASLRYETENAEGVDSSKDVDNSKNADSNVRIDPKGLESLQSLLSQHDAHKSEEETENYFAGGSETSGQQILGPKAQKRVHMDTSTPAITSTDSMRSLRTWGHGERLGSAHPINPPSTRPHSSPVEGHESDSDMSDSEHRIVILHLWAEGFSLDDGSLRPYDLPENERFLREILRGQFPEEMKQYGHRIDLSVQDHTNQSFRHLSRRQFMGSGRLLGSPTPELSVNISTIELTQEQVLQEQELLAERTLNFDETAPIVTIQVRLADGSRISARFNETHTIGELYRYVRISRPQYSSVEFVLMTAFPRETLDERDERTLAKANLKKVLVIQHIN